jgi:hypothetical protein
MKKISAGESAAPVTTRQPFYRIAGADLQPYHLFEVAAGIPPALALAHSVHILYSAQKTFSSLLESNVTETTGHEQVWLQLEATKALLDAVSESFVKSLAEVVVS